jgi:hypothetical protein
MEGGISQANKVCLAARRESRLADLIVALA